MDQQPEPVVAHPSEAVCSLACLLAECEIASLFTLLRNESAFIVSAICVLDQPARPMVSTVAQPALGEPVFLRLDEFPTRFHADVIVISDRHNLIGREAAFTVIELALKGAAVCTLSQFLAAPSVRRGPVPEPPVVQHLLAALVETEGTRRRKRAADLVLGALGLLLTLPVFVAIVAAIKLDSPGPAFFVQERLGRLRVPFRCLKFRTMRQDAERTTGPVWAAHDDPRITRVGRILRRSRLDELPQLINVIHGEMSLVGARPIRRHFADQLAAQVPFYELRFLHKPGLTGLAQVKYVYCSSFTEQIEKFYYDLYYTRHHSAGLDLYIMMMTVWVMVRMRGA